MKIDGVDILVEGSGPDTLVFVHGWPDTHRLWDGTVAALKDRHRCVRFTLPGFDRAHERRARTLGEILAFLHKVVDAVAPGGKVTLVLHDWGCVFGYQYYLAHPDRVARIVGVDIGDSHSLKREATLTTMLAVLAYQWTLAAAWKIGGARGDAMTRWMAAKLRCPADPALIHSGMDYPYFLLWFGREGAFRGAMKPFEPGVPMLYIYGRKKPFMFHAREWLARIRQGKGNRVEEFDTNHWVMINAPERFHQIVGDWLGGKI